MGRFVEGFLGMQKFKALQQEIRKNDLEIAEWQADRANRDRMRALELARVEAETQHRSTLNEILQATKPQLIEEAQLKNEEAKANISGTKARTKGTMAQTEATTASTAATKQGMRQSEQMFPIQLAQGKANVDATNANILATSASTDLTKANAKNALMQGLGFASEALNSAGGLTQEDIAGNAKYISNFFGIKGGDKEGTTANTFITGLMKNQATMAEQKLQAQNTVLDLQRNNATINQAQSLIEAASRLNGPIDQGLETIAGLMPNLASTPGFQVAQTMIKSGGGVRQAGADRLDPFSAARVRKIAEDVAELDSQIAARGSDPKLKKDPKARESYDNVLRRRQALIDESQRITNSGGVLRTPSRSPVLDDSGPVIYDVPDSFDPMALASHYGSVENVKKNPEKVLKDLQADPVFGTTFKKFDVSKFKQYIQDVYKAKK